MTTVVATQRELHHTGATVADHVGVATVGTHVTRYGLALVMVWIGAMKFTTYEAEAIQGLVANSPFMGWIYSLISVQAAAMLIVTSELVIAALIAARPWSPRLSAIGSGLAVGMFLTTLSFLFSTPGVAETSAGGFPAVSVLPGQFLLKDIVLLGAAIWLTGEAWEAADGENGRQS